MPITALSEMPLLSISGMNKFRIACLQMDFKISMLHFVLTLQWDASPCGSIVIAIFYPPSLGAQDRYSGPL